MRKFKVGDQIIAVKDSEDGWYRAGDEFTVTDAGNGFVYVHYPDAPGQELSIRVRDFRPIKGGGEEGEAT